MKQTMLFVVLLLIVGVMSADAVTKTRTADGDWNVSTSWKPTGVPGASNDVEIGGDWTVTLNVSAACASLKLGNNTADQIGDGTLIINAGNTLTVGGNVQIGDATTRIGTIQFQTAGSGLLDMTSATATLTFANTGSSFSGYSAIKRAVGGSGTFLFSSPNTRLVTVTQPAQTVTVETYPNTVIPVGDTALAIKRYYTIAPSDTLTATLRLAYSDPGELNSLTEANFSAWRYSTVWVDQGGAVVDTSDYVEVSGVSSWSNWTIAEASGPLPIQLASFTGTALSNGHVRLNWMTVSELNNYGFEVQRSTEATGSYQTIPNSFVQGHGTTTEPQYYTHTDVTSTPGRWYYRLKQYDLDGVVHYTEGILVDSPTGVGEETTPVAFEVSQNYPNPFNPSTSIKFSLPERTHVTLKVYNLLGKEIATLVNGDFSAGRHDVQWNASDVASGVYMYRIQAGNFVETRRLTLIK